MRDPLDGKTFFARSEQPRRWSFTLLALGCVGWIGCVSDKDAGDQNQDELTAILEDGDLTVLSRSALMAPPPPPPIDGSIPVTGVGGAMVMGGTGGAAGSPQQDGGPIMGIGGNFGTGGIFTVDGGFGTGGRFPGDGGVAGRPGDGGMAGFPGGSTQGQWTFDDCNSSRTELRDSSSFGHTAFRSVSVACVTGELSQGVGINEDDDLVYVPDQPDFTFANGVTAAAWVKPTKLGGVRTIFRKRESGTSTFVLLTNGKTYQFVIRLANGRAAAVSAPASLNTFTHVAATYDGSDLRLYLNGVLATHSRVTGVLSNGAGPLLMGNDALDRRIDGTLDTVFFATRPSSDAEIARLACVPRPSTLIATPASSGPVAAGTAVTYDLALTNNSCDPAEYEIFASPPTTDLTVNPSFALVFPGAGQTVHQPTVVTSSPTIEPDDYTIPISAFPFSTSQQQLNTSVTYSVAGTPCSVRSRRELEIRDLSVVEDAVRTAPGGAWTFQHLMENMAPSADQAPAMVEALLSTWLTDQSVGAFTVASRQAMQDVILGPFPRTASGALDLAHAPFRLLAIANRIDLHNVSAGSAGEGRFAFGLLDQFGNSLQMTLIVEFNIPASSAQDVSDLATAWHGLSALPFPSEQYNVALQAITDKFTARNAAPGRVNGSALGQLRTNDFFALGEWEFREFHLAASDGFLHPAPVALTPDASLNNTTTLADYLNANAASILDVTHVVPETFEGQPFQAGSMITNFFVWNAPGVDPEVRAKFAQNTCNGCHTSSLETNTFVFQIAPRSPGRESTLSPFLLGTQVVDPFANVLRNFNELARRGRVLHDIVCPDEHLPPLPPDEVPLPGGGPDGGFGGSPGTDGSVGEGGGFGGDNGGMMGVGGSMGGPSRDAGRPDA
jgi:hypothetical protein